MSGWIKLHRSFSEWGWKTDPNMVALWVHLLTKASFEDNEFLGVKLNPGQLITGRKKLSVETGISERTIRTCLNSLKSTNEVTIKTTSKYSIITITKWSEYQLADQVSDQQTTSKRPASDQQVTTTKELKNLRTKERTNENFEEFWKVYPNSKSKSGTLKAYEKILKSKQATPEQLLIAARNHARDINGKDKKYAFAGYNFINQGHWRDYLSSNPEAKPKETKKYISPEQKFLDEHSGGLGND